MNDLLDTMIEWEEGQLTDQETIDLFQKLVDSGVAWELQGAYGRMAAYLINEGHVTGRATTSNER
jgi:hypothetical protein